MYFKRIEMQGFKSFADPVSIELNNGITCIIGPNGSGKSNISDALRWVLGEQSPKQLRGGKMQEVIFAGTATRKPKGMAEVTLVIDNSSGFLPIEYNEVAVTRRMYRSGESEYLINGNQCRLRDIKELFMDTGIGVDGYSIIGQGKIADIVSNKADDRRAIFEEAAGVVLYKSRKHDAENKLKAANENLERVRDIISEIEGRIDGLKEESEKAEEFIVLRDRYKNIGVNIILHNLESLERNVQAGRQQLSDLREEYETVKTRGIEIDDELERLRRKEAELSAGIEEANAALLSKIEELNLISSRGQLNTEKLANIENQLIKLGARLDESNAKLESEREAFRELEEKEKEIGTAREEERRLHSEAVFNYNEHVRKAGIIEEQIEKSKDRVIELTNKKISGAAEAKTLRSYLETLNSRKESLILENEGRGERDLRSRQRLSELEAEYESKEQRLKEIISEGESIGSRITSLNEEAAGISADIESRKADMHRAAARKNTIEEMEANYEGYNSSVRALMNRSFSGIIGTVSDIIEVPKGYETAVETALGGALQNIVCRNDESAKEAIRYLKSAKAGRATFLPVDSIKGGKLSLDSEITSAPGFISIASDVIGIHEKYRNISEYLLGRVIIADSMENAVRLSKYRTGGARIVTLDGEIINSGGAITGGRYANRTANLLERKKEIQSLNDRISELENEIEELKSERESRFLSIQKLKRDREDLNSAYQSLVVDYNVLKTDIEHEKELAKAADKADERFQDEINSIEDDSRRAAEMIAGYERAGEEADREIEQIESSMESLLAEADKYSSIIEEDSERIVQHKVKLGEHDTKILSQNELIERVRDVITELEDSINTDEEERRELSDARILLTDSGQESGEKEALLREEKKALESDIDNLNQAAEDARASYETMRTEVRKNQERMETLSDEKYKLELKNTKNETLLETQKDKLWDEFEVSYAEARDMRDENFAITSGNRELRDIKLRMAELGDVNISSIEEYRQVSKRYKFMSEQEADTTKAMKELEDIIRSMDNTIRKRFKETFDEVVTNFEVSFRELFGGGHAELYLEDENNPLESGIEITAQPPGKKLKNINLLSGGEKTLTAIALMFAVLKAKPTPFCILDEVEAALDEVNIERFSRHLRNFSEVQFALITHQKATMEHADVLYGVTMPEQGISKLLSLKMGEDIDTEQYTS